MQSLTGAASPFR